MRLSQRGTRFLFLAVTALLLAAPLSWVAPNHVTASNASLAIPATAAGEHLSWALAQINTGASGTATADVANRFADDFLAALPAKDLIAVFANLEVAIAPVSVVRFEGGVTETRARALLATATGELWRVNLGLQEAEPHLIDDLFFEPVPTPTPIDRAPKSWVGLDSRLKKVAPEVGFFAAEIVDGGCQVINDVNADESLAVGSSFKLYVLGALARQIETGEASWDEPLAIESTWKSLPSGDLRLESAGTDFPLRTYAEQMISVSDNTATDHLIYRLGRENVEAAMSTMGHSDPSLNTPLLTTREWFGIKLRFSDKEIDAYADAGDAEQRQILATDASDAADSLGDDEEWIGPNHIDSIEWFASAADLCRAIGSLHTMAGKEGFEPIHDALSLNPGLAFDPETWSYVGFKGGYETGVKSQVWLLQRADGRWFAMTSIINDPDKEINGPLLTSLMVTAADLLAKES